MNNSIFYFFHSLAHQYAFLDNVIIFFAVYFPYVVVFIAAVFLLMHHEILKAEAPAVVLMEKKREFLSFFISGALGYGVASILKTLFNTLRPFNTLPEVNSLFAETGHAFPSSHAAFFAAIAFAIFFTHKKAGYVFLFFALVIGLARVAAGVHFPIDIVGGLLLGAGVSYLVAYFSKNV